MVRYGMYQNHGVLLNRLWELRGFEVDQEILTCLGYGSPSMMHMWQLILILINEFVITTATPSNQVLVIKPLKVSVSTIDMFLGSLGFPNFVVRVKCTFLVEGSP